MCWVSKERESYNSLNSSLFSRVKKQWFNHSKYSLDFLRLPLAMDGFVSFHRLLMHWKSLLLWRKLFPKALPAADRGQKKKSQEKVMNFHSKAAWNNRLKKINQYNGDDSRIGIPAERSLHKELGTLHVYISDLWGQSCVLPISLDHIMTCASPYYIFRTLLAHQHPSTLSQWPTIRT